ncbi:hypothetical protein [Haliangium sp.]|uniref:hypothetical protein n=1 Tax=Haliangium sp. TaxID=2663208 RepID=UPI003D0E93B9
MPTTLRESGLYTDLATEELAPGVREYRPAFELWSDGAVKRRWIYLPAGEQIDTSDMNYWRYPVGTKLWKEFRRDDVRVETRLYYKIGPTTWYRRTFAWNQSQTEAVESNFGDDNVLGTEHDIPALRDCDACHGNMPDLVLGFSALQLDHDGPGVTLQTLIDEGRLTNDPPGAAAPRFPLPGNTNQRNALGYLHGNCGGCHNPRSDVYSSGDALIELRLDVSRLGSVEATPAFSTAVCAETQQTLAGINQVIVPGDPQTSAMFVRMNLRDKQDQMPPAGTELVDDIGVDYIRLWINGISTCPQ